MDNHNNKENIKKKTIVEPASNNTMPPQFSDPKHQMYEGLLPTKDFNYTKGESIPVLPNVDASSFPGEYMGVKVIPADSLKADLMTSQKRQFKTQAIGSIVELAAAQKKLIVVRSMNDLTQLYPTKESLEGKHCIIIGGLPRISLEGEKFIILPKQVAEKVGLSVGEVTFPVRPSDDKIPLLQQSNHMIEKMVSKNETINMITSGVFLFVVLIVLIFSVRSN